VKATYANQPIINEIGIDLCVNRCPYYDHETGEGDCVGIDDCQVMQEEIERVKAEYKADTERADNAMVQSILASVKSEGPLTMPELSEIHGYSYADIDRLVRLGKLNIKKVREGKRTKIEITP
jgi:hypothetical protein